MSNKLLTVVLKFNNAGGEIFVTGLPSSIRKQDITEEETSRSSPPALQKIKTTFIFSRKNTSKVSISEMKRVISLPS